MSPLTSDVISSVSRNQFLVAHCIQNSEAVCKDFPVSCEIPIKISESLTLLVLVVFCLQFTLDIIADG